MDKYTYDHFKIAQRTYFPASVYRSGNTQNSTREASEQSYHSLITRLKSYPFIVDWELQNNESAKKNGDSGFHQ